MAVKTMKNVQIRCNLHINSPIYGSNVPDETREVTFKSWKPGQPIEPQASHDPSSGRRSICSRSLDRKSRKK
jgi:hypothetical protein